MKAVYIKHLQSGNYKIISRTSASPNSSERFTTKRELLVFWNRVRSEKSNTWVARYSEFKNSQIVKACYSQSQTYYTSFDELYAVVLGV